MLNNKNKTITSNGMKKIIFYFGISAGLFTASTFLVSAQMNYSYPSQNYNYNYGYSYTQPTMNNCYYTQSYPPTYYGNCSGPGFNYTRNYNNYNTYGNYGYNYGNQNTYPSTQHYTYGYSNGAWYPGYSSGGLFGSTNTNYGNNYGYNNYNYGYNNYGYGYPNNDSQCFYTSGGGIACR